MSALRRIGGPYAISAWSVLLPGLLWPLAAWSNPRLGGTVADWALVGGVSLAVVGAVLIVARLTVLPCRPRAPRPVTALAVFALAGALHGAVSEWLRVDLGIDPDPSPSRIALRTALAVAWLGMIALAVDESRRHRAVLAELGRRLEEQREVERLERGRLEELVREVRAEAVAPVLAALERIRTALRRTDGAEAEAALRLGDVIARQVRPLSHTLLDDAAGWAPPAVLDAPPPWTRRLARIAAAACSRPAFHPWVGAIVYEATVTPMLVEQGTSTAVAVANAIVGTAILGGGGVLANRLAGDRLRTAGPVAGVALAVGAGVVAIAAGNAVFALLTAVLADGPAWYPITLITFPLLVLILNVVGGVGRDRMAEEERLAAASRQVDWAIARIAQRVRHERRLLGAWLHGPMQGSLLAVAARLERAGDAERAAAITQALPELATVIEAAQRLVDGEEPVAATELAALDDVVRMWQGVLEVEIAIDRGVRGRLTADPSALAVVVDLVAEALANAVRHGGAAQARVRVDVVGPPDRLLLQVADDGVLAEDPEPGMGSRLLDAVALEWSLAERADGWTELVVETPLGAAVAPSGALAAAVR